MYSNKGQIFLYIWQCDRVVNKNLKFTAGRRKSPLINDTESLEISFTYARNYNQPYILQGNCIEFSQVANSPHDTYTAMIKIVNKADQLLVSFRHIRSSMLPLQKLVQPLPQCCRCDEFVGVDEQGLDLGHLWRIMQQAFFDDVRFPTASRTE